MILLLFFIITIIIIIALIIAEMLYVVGPPPTRLHYDDFIWIYYSLQKFEFTISAWHVASLIIV